MRIVAITGGCGFVGTNLVKYLLKSQPDWILVNIDALTYAANQYCVDLSHYNYVFHQADIRDRVALERIFAYLTITDIIHLAAESHVDVSLNKNRVNDFVTTNVEGTLNLLKIAKDQPGFNRFLFISTDEVYGPILEGAADEHSPLNPTNPYAATKAGAEHLVRAYQNSYGMDTVITRCVNNIGPYQHPEKFVPASILRLSQNKPVLLYGNGQQRRSWIDVRDHCKAIESALLYGKSGETYNVPGAEELSNYGLAIILCDFFNKHPDKFISFIEDRPGHDVRYSLKSTKIDSLGIESLHREYWLNDTLQNTVDWYENKFIREFHSTLEAK